jgi:hypothetical protein
MASSFPRRRFSLLLALVGACALLVLGETARAATDCRQQVIDDWSADGRVDRIYGLECYQQAVEALAPDIRDYTDAQESIERALMLAIRAKREQAQGQTQAPARSLAAAEQVDPGGTPAVPIPLLVLGALAGTALVAGGVAFVGHRARSGREGRGR